MSLLAGLLLGAQLALAAAGKIALSPCRPPGVDETVRCGDVLVPEDPRSPHGREIKLHVVVVPAVAGDVHRAPLFDLAGGPGVAGSGAAQFYTTAGRIHRQDRDVVLVDQRGTGESNPLNCPDLALGGPFAGHMYPPAAVARCRQALAAHADLAQYTTARAAADLDAARSALGYAQIDLSALSYGTRLAVAYMRLFPTHVRSAVLIGTVADGKKLPLWHARNAQEVLARLFDQCRADETCHGAFPDLPAEWSRVLDAVRTRPVTATVTVAGKPETVSLQGGSFEEAFRAQLVTTGGQLRAPYLIHRMSMGDWAPFVSHALGGGAPLAEGLYLSVTCAEDTPLITPAERLSATEGTFLGTYRIDEQQAACREWKVPVARPVVTRAATRDVPVLLLAGGMDYVTPAAWAHEVAAGFPRSRVVEIPGLGHYPDGLEHLECFDEMMAAFFARPDPAALDTSCVAAMRRPPFVRGEKEAGP
jgi:pimeloyl-ACP methyl ester carboxylesterase